MHHQPQTTYPDRRWVVPLAATVMVGFGIILYGFSVYATDQAAGADFSSSVLSIAYGGAVFVGGLTALPVGRFADRHGIRLIVGVGSVLAFTGFALFAVAREPWHVIVAWWVLIGPAQAMVYYEPAYVAIDQWASEPDRARTLGTITVIGGLAGIVFIPLAERLVALLGWRQAVFGLGTLLLVVGASTAVAALPRWRSDWEHDTHRPAVAGDLLRDRRFLLYTLALMLILLSTQGIIAHRVVRFEEGGLSVATVAVWAAVASAMSLPGRWIAPRMAARYGPTRVQAIVAVVVAASVVLMIDGSSSWQMIAHFALFGMAFGALLPLRALVMGGWFSGPTFGRIMGVQWTGVVLVAAAGPVAVGLLRDATDSYRASFAMLTAFYVLAAAAILASGRASNILPHEAGEDGPVS